MSGDGVISKTDGTFHKYQLTQQTETHFDKQKGFFTSWVNTHLKDNPISDLRVDFKDGLKLAQLVLKLARKEEKDIKIKLDKNPTNDIKEIQNIKIVLDFCKNEEKINFVAIGPQDFNIGVKESILGFLQTLILKYQIGDKNAKIVPVTEWIQEETKDLKGVEIKNFTTSFQSGLALSALIYKANPKLLDFDKLLTQKGDPVELNQAAIDLAAKELDIPPILNGYDIVHYPNEFSMKCYVCYFRQKKIPFFRKPEDEENKRLSKTQISIKKEQEEKNKKEELLKLEEEKKKEEERLSLEEEAKRIERLKLEERKKLEEEEKIKKEEERKLEEERLRLEEDERKRKEEEERNKLEEEERMRRAQEERLRLEEEERKRLEEEIIQREEEKKREERKIEEERLRREEERKRLEEERTKLEEERLRLEEDERKRKEEEERKKLEEEEEERKRKEEEERKKLEEEEEERKKLEEEEDERKRKEEEERKKLEEEEEERKREEEEEEERKREEEEERKKLEEEERMRRAQEERIRFEEEERKEDERKLEEERLRLEEEERKRKEESLKREEEKKRLEEERMKIEKERFKKEEEERIQNEEKPLKLEGERKREERKRIEEEESLRLEQEEKERLRLEEERLRREDLEKIQQEEEITPLLNKKESTKRKVKTTHKYQSPSVFSYIFFDWVSDIVYKGNSEQLETEDVLELSDTNNGNYNYQILSKNVKNTEPKNMISFLWVIFKTYWFFVLLQSALHLISLAGYLSGPYLIQQLLKWFENAHRIGYWYLEGYFWTFLIFINAFLSSLLDIHYRWVGFGSLYMKIKSGLIQMIYKKGLSISSTKINKETTGKLFNIMNQDTEKISEIFDTFGSFFFYLFQMIGCLILLYWLIGWKVFVGMGVILVLMPIQGIILIIFTSLVDKSLGIKDQRIDVLNEILQGIKIIKFFSWEEEYQNKIENLRNKELGLNTFLGFLYGLTLTIMSATPTLVSVSTFLLFYYLDQSLLKPDIIFPVLSYFMLLKYPMIVLPWCFSEAIQSLFSLKRIFDYLNLEEIQKRTVVFNDFETPIKIEDATFSYEGSEFKIQDINMNIKKGQLIFIVGNVGSGKSSLLDSIIGDTIKEKGKIQISGQIAYSPQQPWIQNLSFKDNIFFGLEEDQRKLDKVIKLCCLKEDLNLLPAREDTELGEKGYNLSGGQKQRVSIARALYKDADIYLFDDPLSALDQNVGSKIFMDCIKDYLSNKTRVIVTHQLQYLNHADYIYVFENGKIVEKGTFDELKSQNQGTLSELIKRFNVEQYKENNEIVVEQKKDLDSKKTITEEEREKGEIKGYVVWEYIKNFGVLSFFITIFLFIISQILSESPNWLMSQWMTDPKQRLFDFTDHTFIIIYFSFGFGSSLILFIRNLFFLTVGVLAARKLHKLAFENLIKAPMSFFETNLIGRIVSRFSADLNMIDADLPLEIEYILSQLMNVLFTFTISVYTAPWFLLPLIPIIILYIVFYQYYKTPFRELKRLSSIGRSPLYSHYSETLNGASTIRAYGLSDKFFNDNENKLNLMQKLRFSLKGLDLWQEVRLSLLGSILVLSSIISCLLIFQRNPDKITTAAIGLLLTYIIQITQVLGALVESFVSIEGTYFNALERIVHYIYNIPSESRESSSVKLTKNWPNGDIEFKDLVVKYRPELPIVLDKISFTIKKGEKVGIVGRTGSGKSTILLTLFRIMEPFSGTIIIDEIDYRKLSLKDLRTSIAIIPQDPVLFSGTIRSNIDPFSKYNDRELYGALEKSHMKDVIEKLEKKLDSEVFEGGKNFSVGQRQLLCLSRCILTKKNILLLDEATASVDISTDELIQKTLKENFQNATVLTIAHRLNTIIDSDRILVLEKGKVVEFDTPNILRSKDSLFSQLLEKEISKVNK